MTVAFHTLGCKVNQYETEEMLENLTQSGYIVTNDIENADVLVVNSCTVTAESDRKSRQTVRKLRKTNPTSIIVLTGCMPQAYMKQAEELLEADIVLGNKSNYLLKDAIEEFISTKKRIFKVLDHQKGEELISSGIKKFNERTRAFLKIEDGCDRFCSYCAIPYARGRVRSKSIEQITNEVKSLYESGFSEIVLVGINLSSYGKDLGISFCDGINAVAKIDGIQRIRLGSLEPDHITDEVIENLSKIDKLCPQFHISLQSGCDNTLKRMNRHYDAKEYLSLCTKLRECFEDCTLTTDIMVGFPGETEQDFLDTVDFVKKVGFEKVHIFPYSRREGTKAATFDGQINNAEKSRRASVLNEVSENIRKDFLYSQIGKALEILVEGNEEDGYHFGYTKNYIPVKFKTDNYDGEKLLSILILSADSEFCYGKIYV